MFKFKKLHLYLIKAFLVPFITTFFIAIFLLLMQFLWKYIDDLVGKGLEIDQLFILLFYASARFVPLALPISMLLSSLMVFGKLAENNELVALKSSGISFFKMLKPLVVLVVIISICSFLFSNYALPIANLKNASMIYDIQKKKPAFNIKEGIFYNDIEGYSLKVGEKNIDGKNLKDIIIYDHSSSNGNKKVIVAKKGIMQLTNYDNFLELKLSDGYAYVDVNENSKNKKTTYRRTYFKSNLIRFDLSNFNILNNSQKLYKGHYAMLNTKQLKQSIDSLNQQIIAKKSEFNINLNKNYNVQNLSIKSKSLENENNYNNKIYSITINKLKTMKSLLANYSKDINYKKIVITKHKIELHRKYSLAFACIILFLIGAPLGSIIKKGGFGLPAVISISFFLLYHVLSMIGEKSAKDLSIEAYEGIWLSNIVFIPISLFLIYKAKNDRDLFSIS
tara:strand:+ start:12076 stop:13422 length:1347 start_codon:yes stop_codon:yes gene_type:complete